jgi:UDP-GlcNAc:undecaprenyl-phosphate/decaprenyl-phosphate GlcNAc-1-phosphate transferase
MGDFPLISVLILSFCMSIAMMPVATWLALKWEATDSPGSRKIHTRVMPRTGGLAIFVAILFGISLALVLQPQLFRSRTASIILAGLPLSAAIGLCDDLFSIQSKLKLALQLVLGCLVFWMGLRIKTLSLGAGYEFELGAWALPATLFWVVGMMNAINLIDGLDGLAAGVCVVAFASVGIFAYGFDNHFVVYMSAIAAAATFGFLRVNYSPAKIFMGDNGSMSLGFLLGVLTLSIAPNKYGSLPLYVPIFLAAFPIVDTTVAIVRRATRTLDQGRRVRHLFRDVLSADGDHIHHRLLSKGFSQRQVAMLLYLFSILTSAIAYLVLILPAPFSWFCTIAALYGIRQMVLALDYSEFSPKEVRLLHQEYESTAPIGVLPSVISKVPRRLRRGQLVANVKNIPNAAFFTAPSNGLGSAAAIGTDESSGSL